MLWFHSREQICQIDLVCIIFPLHARTVKVSFTRETRTEDGETLTKTVKRTLFQRGNSYPQKKVLTFNRYSDDFPFQVFYGDLEFLSAEELR